MTTTDQRTVIVTGASGGIGAAIAAHLSRTGWRVFPTMRHPDADRNAPDALALDVTSDESIDTVVTDVLTRTGRIDAVVNNAGVSLVGAIEETSTAEAKALFDTNFFGVHRLCRAVLPTMRAQGTGRLVTIGSIGGFLPEPYEAFYSAAKHALEGYVETLDFEVRPFGLRALLIQPGFIATNLATNTTQVADTLAVYDRARRRAGTAQNANIGRGAPPEAVARAMAGVLTARAPRLRTRVGADAHQLHLVYKYLPPPLFAAGLRRRWR